MRIILNKVRLGTVLVASALLATTALASCSSSTSRKPAAPARPVVVAAENFWGSIAAQIAGSDAQVSSIINNPDTDPHDYEPTARDARTIASADLVIENGIGYDAWAQQLIDADGSSTRKVLNVGRLLGVPNGGNPHQWYSQVSVERFIVAVTTDLESIDPQHRADYELNERNYVTTALGPYDALIAQIKQKFSGTPIGASESIVSPLAQTLALDMRTPESFLDAIAEGNEPTAADKATADTQIEQHEIKVFVFNTQNSTPDVQRLVDEARRAGIPIATVTETLAPEGASFQDWQVGELRGLLAALEKAVH